MNMLPLTHGETEGKVHINPKVVAYYLEAENGGTEIKFSGLDGSLYVKEDFKLVADKLGRFVADA